MTPREYWSELCRGGVTAEGVRYGAIAAQRLLIVAESEILLLTEEDVLQWFQLEDFPSPAMEAMSASPALLRVMLHVSAAPEQRLVFGSVDIPEGCIKRLRSHPDFRSARGNRVVGPTRAILPFYR